MATACRTLQTWGIYDRVTGRPSQVVKNEGTLSYSYNQEGQLASVKGSRPTGDVESYYYYDKAGRLEMVDAPSGVTRCSYNQDGTRAAQVLPNGVRTSYSYDNLNRTTLIDHKNPLGTTISSFAYTVGRTSKRLGVDEVNGGAAASWDYTYDGLGRLTYAVREEGAATKSWEYQYDLVGNRIQQVRDGLDIAYTYNELDQLLSEETIHGATDYAYDGNGNLTRKSWTGGEVNYLFDSRNRLRQVYQGAVQPNNLWLEYAYDVAQNRVAKAVRSGGTITGTGFLIDDNNLTGYTQALMEFDLNTNEPQRRYDYGDDLLTQVNTPTDSALATPYFFQYDALGSTRSLTNESAVSSEEYGYEAFGASLNSSIQPLAANGFAGEYRDDLLDFHYFRARYYDASSGRFLSRDACEDGANKNNPYSYCNADPVDLVDMSGNTVMGTLGALVAGFAVTMILNMCRWNSWGLYPAFHSRQNVNSGLGSLAKVPVGKTVVLENRERIKRIAQKYKIEPLALAALIAAEASYTDYGEDLAALISIQWEYHLAPNPNSSFDTIGHSYGWTQMHVYKAQFAARNHALLKGTRQPWAFYSRQFPASYYHADFTGRLQLTTDGWPILKPRYDMWHAFVAMNLTFSKNFEFEHFAAYIDLMSSNNIIPDRPRTGLAFSRNYGISKLSDDYAHLGALRAGYTNAFGSDLGMTEMMFWTKRLKDFF